MEESPNMGAVEEGRSSRVGNLIKPTTSYCLYIHIYFPCGLSVNVAWQWLPGWTLSPYQEGQRFRNQGNSQLHL